jgi:hypothetical protein
MFDNTAMEFKADDVDFQELIRPMDGGSEISAHALVAASC